MQSIVCPSASSRTTSVYNSNSGTEEKFVSLKIDLGSTVNTRDPSSHKKRTRLELHDSNEQEDH